MSLTAKAIAAAVLCGLLLSALWGYGRRERLAGRAEIRAEWTAAALAQSEVNRENERLNNRARTGAEDAERKRAARAAAVAADLRRHADSLRDDIAAFAAGRDAANDSAAACAGRALALGGVLDAALRDSATCAEAGERDAGIARGLRESWPEGLRP